MSQVTIKSRVEVAGMVYLPGDTVELTDRQVARLVEAGAVEHVLLDTVLHEPMLGGPIATVVRPVPAKKVGKKFGKVKPKRK
jgi:hypothetical protein